ncbi:sensor histidine kinase [Cohnella luojiensis]|nr:histidine kinase [Cohnella luojiensis]
MRWLKKSLFAKLLVVMLISATVPFTLSNMISYKTTSTSVERQIIELNLNTMDVGLEHVQRYLHDLNRISVSLYYRETLMNDLRQSVFLPNQILSIGNQINLMYNQRSEFRGVTYTSAINGQTFTRFKEGLPANTSHPFNSSIGQTENRLYTVSHVGNERVLAVHKKLIDYPDPQVLGYLSIYSGLEEIGNLIRSAASPSKDQVFLYLHENMELLYATEESAPHHEWTISKVSDLTGKRGVFNGNLNGENGIFIYVKKNYLELPLTVFKFVSNTAINESANQTLNRSLLIQSIAILFVIILASTLSYLTLAPIKRLLRTIARVQTGNFDVKPEGERLDELGILEKRFQTMIRNLDDLMNREYRNRLELSTAQIKMLQAQINPHFLYNALQSIGTLALRHGSEEINKKIAELGSILRYSMDFKVEEVTMQTEIQHIEHYLSLQTGRFRNRLLYTLSCSEEAMQVRIPKMILQPLIENSIIHGLERGKGSGTLHISIEMDDELWIRIIDNGKGIPPETIERIRKDYAKQELHSGEESGIGLINVLNRMRLYFGQEFSWEINSIPYEVTTISLQIAGNGLRKE